MGDVISIDVDVIDEEGDKITAIMRIESLGVSMRLTKNSEAGVPVAFSFEYTCTLSQEAPYVVEVEARDDAEHYLSNWNTAEIELLVNSPPEAVLEVDRSEGDFFTIFHFDASGSSDQETATEELKTRWDWDGDGVWDTGWYNRLEGSYQYIVSGVYNITVEVMDGNGLTSNATVQVEVSGEIIPEFSHVIIPVFAVLALILFNRFKRSR